MVKIMHQEVAVFVMQAGTGARPGSVKRGGKSQCYHRVIIMARKVGKGCKKE